MLVQMVFTTLAHHIDIDLLLEAYRRTRKDSSKLNYHVD